MRLLRVTLHQTGPFDDAILPLGELLDPPDDDETVGIPPEIRPRPFTVLFGGDGTGKTTILSAIALTRPGHALPPVPSSSREGKKGPPWIATDWLLGEDDPERPHPLVVASPVAVLPGETEGATIARRREQVVFERRAAQIGGHVFVSFSGARWFSRTPNMLSTPERSILRYDVRQPGTSFDDPTRADLTRETKQILSFAAIASALSKERPDQEHLRHFDAALREVVDIVLEPFGLAYEGVSPTSLEPVMRTVSGAESRSFDAIPRAARHLVSFVTLPLRALFAAYPDLPPRGREGVVVIDDVESQQDPTLLRHLGPLLHQALPNVQWIVTTSSTQLALACDASSVIALRKTPEAKIELEGGILH